MTVLIGSSATGSNQIQTRIGEPIKAPTLRVVLQDMHRAWERLTGLAADQAGTTAASINTVHGHNEEGNLMPRCFASWRYGTQGPNGETNSEANASTTYAAPFTITETSSTTPADNLLCMAPLIYVEPAWVDRDIVFMLDTNGDPDMVATLYDDTGAAVAAYSGMRFGIGRSSLFSFDVYRLADAYAENPFCVVFQVPAAGVYYLDVRTNLRAGESVRQIFGGMILGVVDVTRMRAEGVPPPPLSAADIHDVGDPDATPNTWQPIDDAFSPSAGDVPLSAALLTKMKENMALLYVKTFGIPVPGNATLQADPHAHTGATGDAPEIKRSHVAVCMGGFAGVNPTEASGQHSRAPQVDSTTTTDVAEGRNFMPDSVNVSAVASNLKFACLVYVETGKSKTSQTTATFGATTKTFQSTVGGNGLELLDTPTAGSNRFEYTPNADNDWSVAHRASVVGTAGWCQLVSFLWYVEP